MRTDGRTGRRTDAQTDKTKLIVAFHNFANRLKMNSADIGNNVYIILP